MLHLIATPIGDPDEISIKALRMLQEADVVICESTKETSTLLKHHQIKAKKYELLNEHTTPEELKHLLNLCNTLNVVLVSDCGTPGFCDPGADLVRLCQKKNIVVKSILGASALMGLISLCGERLDQFLFRGFIPAENEARAKEWTLIKTQKVPMILMDTPYRLKKIMSELLLHMPDRECILTLNLSQADECTLRGTPSLIASQLQLEKAEFMLLVLGPKVLTKQGR